MYIPPLLELIIRFFYFGLGFEKLFKFRNNKSKKPIMKIKLEEIEKKMVEHGIKKGDTIMVHSSFKYVEGSADDFIEFLKRYIGKEGNILMPTHPQLQEEKEVLVYDVGNSPSTMGYLTEKFREGEDVERSKHPFSSVAAWGKNSKYFLKDNLNNTKPLPHGKDSPYYKLTEFNGKVLCLGVSAKGRATIKHVAEEVLDEEFPIKNLFQEHIVIIRTNSGEIENCKVRLLNLKKSQVFVAKSKVEKEWLNNNILIKDSINGIPFEIVDAKKCVNYMIGQAKIGNTSYPFLRKG